MEKVKHIVILAAGSFPTHEEPLRALREADFVVCCDSAYEAFKDDELKEKNYVVIGDGDSLSPCAKQQLGDRYVQIDEQDYNDLHKAMDWATSRFGIQNSEFRIIAACGKREDHTLGNIGYLVTFAEEYPDMDIEMLTDHGRFTTFRGCRTYNSFAGQQISIFSMDSDKPIYSEGLKWPLDGLHARRWWQATLNEALADSFELRSEGWTVVYQTF